MPEFMKGRFFAWGVGGVVAVAVLIGGVFWWMDKQTHVDTDNAFVQADTSQVSPQISGYVLEVAVQDNQTVRAGDVLVRLDPAPFQARLDAALANAEAARAAVRGVDDRASQGQAMVSQRIAGLASAEAAAQAARNEAARSDALRGQGWVSQQRVESQNAAAQQATAAVTQAKAAVEAERRTLQGTGSAREQALAQVAAAEAAVAQARIDLERTVIRAPIAGVVGARAVRAGQQVQPGLVLMAVVPLGQAYVVANFKETQLTRLRIGQTVTIHADAFGDQVILGRVDSFSPATGAEFALIPVENAVGNFTKVTQRVPVRISVRPGPFASALRPGLSVSVKVDVTRNTGPSFVEVAAQPARAVATAPSVTPASAPR